VDILIGGKLWPLMRVSGNVKDDVERPNDIESLTWTNTPGQ